MRISFAWPKARPAAAASDSASAVLDSVIAPPPDIGAAPIASPGPAFQNERKYGARRMSAFTHIKCECPETGRAVRLSGHFPELLVERRARDAEKLGGRNLVA